MKNLLLILAIFFVIPSQMNGNFTTNKQISTIEITSDLLKCESTLVHDSDKWIVRHVKPLKTGLNKFYFVPFENMSINIEIIKY